MSKVYMQQKRPVVKAPGQENQSVSAHTPSLVGGESREDLNDLMLARFQQHFQNNQIPTAEAEADRIAASVRGARTPEEVKQQLGEKMGADFSDIRFHTDAASAGMADAMGARAYTSGRDVTFGSGGFDAATAAHELVHTVQQGVVSSAMSTLSAPTGGVQMKPNIFKRAWNSIKRRFSGGEEAAAVPAPASVPAQAQARSPAPAPTQAQAQAPAPTPTYSHDALAGGVAKAMESFKPVADRSVAESLKEDPSFDYRTDGGRFAHFRGKDVPEYLAGLSSAMSPELKGQILDSFNSRDVSVLPKAVQEYDMPLQGGGFEKQTVQLGMNQLMSNVTSGNAPQEQVEMLDAYENMAMGDISTMLNLFGKDANAMDAIKTASEGYMSLGDFDAQTNRSGLVAGKKEALFRSLNDFMLRNVNTDLTLNASRNKDPDAKRRNIDRTQIIMSLMNKSLTKAVGGTLNFTKGQSATEEMITEFLIQQGLLDKEK